MHTYRIKIDHDGRTTIPDTKPGQTVTIHIEARDEPLTLANTQSDEERDAVIAGIRRIALELRDELDFSDEKPLSLAHGELLYDEHGLPK